MADTKSILDLSGVDVVVHASWIMKPRNTYTAQVNVRASLQLLHQLSERNIPSIFVSSLSAHSGSKSLYGQSKYEVERHFLRFEKTIIRPGLVIDRLHFARGGFYNSSKDSFLKALLSKLLSTDSDYPYTDSDVLVTAIGQMILGKSSNNTCLVTGKISLSQILAQADNADFKIPVLTEKRIQFLLQLSPLRTSKLSAALDAFQSLIDSRSVGQKIE
jgi:dTDP-4-dehydrorhamnose reductase